MGAATALTWAALPVLGPRACTPIYDDLAESQRRYSGAVRQAMALWFKHALKLGLVSPEDLAAALSAAHPFTALDRLYVETRNALARHLNEVVARHAMGGEHHVEPSIDIGLVPGGDGAEPALTISLDTYYAFDIGSLHRLPRTLAALVHESLDIVSRCLVPCLLPREMWDGRFNWLLEDAGEEYLQLRHAGALHDIEAAAEYLKARGSGYYFSTDPEELREQIARFRMMLEGRPAWMRLMPGTRPIARARRLNRAAEQYAIEHGGHPWATYVRDVCNTVCALDTDDGARTRRLRREDRYRHDDGTEGATALSAGLWVRSGTPTEQENAETLFQGMSEAGETPMECYALARLAPSRLLAILERIAIGVGLLLRADQVNAQVSTPRFRDRSG